MSSDSAIHNNRLDRESVVRRNPHPDFKEVEASRADWSHSPLTWVKTPKPDWKFGDGGNDGEDSIQKTHVEIDPWETGRPSIHNYKLLISAIVPRFIGFISTLSADGKSANLAPYSYTTVISHDPPIFIIGHAGGLNNAKDTLRNVLETQELVINVVSEHFIEAANSTSVNAPYEVSEWVISGLHQAPSTTVKPARVKEAVFSVECKLIETKEFESRSAPGKKATTMLIVEGTRFWAREDAINEDRTLLDPAIVKPMSRMGGITYGRTSESMELPRPDWNALQTGQTLKGVLPPSGSL